MLSVFDAKKQTLYKHNALSWLISFLNPFAWDTRRRVKAFVTDEDVILDIGCRHAPYTRNLKNKTIAIDTDFPKLKQLRMFSKENINVLLASAEYLPTRSKAFDLIVCTEVLEYIRNDRLAIFEMSRVLRRWGRVYLTTPNGAFLHSDCSSHRNSELIHHYREKELIDLFYGYFDIVNTEKRFGFWSNLLCLHHSKMISLVGNNLMKGERRRMKYLHACLLAIVIIVLAFLINVLILIEEKTSQGNYNIVITCTKSL